MQSLEDFAASLAEAIFVSGAVGPEPLAYVGVRRFKRDGEDRWGARIFINRNRVTVGVFDTAELAASAVDIALLALGREPRNYPRGAYDAAPSAPLAAARQAVCDRIRIYLH